MTIDSLLQDLRYTRTDLPALVSSVRDTRRNLVIVSARAIDAWSTREPEAWRKVHAWLAEEGVAVRVV
jgi:hypothetical protein